MRYNIIWMAMKFMNCNTLKVPDREVIRIILFTSLLEIMEAGDIYSFMHN